MSRTLHVHIPKPAIFTSKSIPLMNYIDAELELNTKDIAILEGIARSKPADEELQEHVAEIVELLNKHGTLDCKVEY